MTRRILQVLGNSAGGIARHVSHVTEALDGRDGFVIDVACPPDLPIAMPKQPLELRIPDGVRGHRDAIRSLRRIVGSGPHDLVHAHGLRAGIDASLAARGLCPVVVTVHNLVRPEIAGAARAKIDRLAEPLVVRLADHVLTVSQEIADRLKRVAPRGVSKIEVLYLGIGDAPQVKQSRSEVRRSLGLADDTCVVVAVARLAPQKALHVMLQALSSTRTGPVLLVLGEGPLERELRDRARGLGLDERVRFLGFRDDVADIVAAADLFCLSSIWEGVPLAVQEAILLGVPVVSTDVGGMGEIVGDRRSGRLVPAGDASALAEAIDDICSSPDHGAVYARRALGDLRVRFSTDVMLERLKTIYKAGPGGS